MSDALQELESRARSVSPKGRATRAQSLLESLRDVPAAEIETVWDAEIAERVADVYRRKRCC